MHKYLTKGYEFSGRVRSVLNTPQEYFFAIQEMPMRTFGRWSSRLIIALILFISLYKLYIVNKKQKSKDFRSILQIFIPMFSLLIIYIIILTLSDTLVYSTKYMIVAFPFCCLLYSVFYIYKEPFRRIIYGIFAFHFCIILFTSYKPPFIQDFDYKSLAKFIQRTDKPEEPILFYNKALAFTFKYYYQGNNLSNPLPELISDDSYYYCDVMDTVNIIESIRKTEKYSELLLLITVADPFIDDTVGLTVNSSEFFISNNYKSTIDTVINGKMYNAKLRIRRLHKK